MTTWGCVAADSISLQTRSKTAPCKDVIGDGRQGGGIKGQHQGAANHLDPGGLGVVFTTANA
jgi:hypothetical protein